MSAASALSTAGTIDIIMIDDDELMLEWAQRALRKSSLSLLPMSDGEGLEKLLALHPVKALIIDYHLARVTGLDLMQALLHAEARLPDIVLLATASRPTADVQARAAELGMQLMLKDRLIDKAALEALVS